MNNALALIPTYNEKENIVRIIEKIFSLPHDFDILVIDDNSPDGTDEIVDELGKKYPGRLFLERREGKLGLGTAYIHGFRWALERTYEYIFEIDADFSHNPEDLIRLYQSCNSKGADMSVGSRYTKGGHVKNWPFGRVLLSYCASLYVRTITWLPVKDPTAGFVCYHRSVIEAIDLSHVRCIGYAFQIEMKFAAWKLGFKLKEVPITFIDRERGVSKMSTKIFKEAFLGVLGMQWKFITGRAKKYYGK